MNPSVDKNPLICLKRTQLEEQQTNFTQCGILSDQLFSNVGGWSRMEMKHLEMAQPVKKQLYRLKNAIEHVELGKSTEMDHKGKDTKNSGLSNQDSSVHDLELELKLEKALALVQTLKMENLNLKGYIRELESDANQTRDLLYNNQTIIKDLVCEVCSLNETTNNLESLMSNQKLEITRLKQEYQDLEHRLYLSETSVMHSKVIRLKSVSLDSMQ